MTQNNTKIIATLRYKGGPGSGHHGHTGRPGKRGGSAPGSGGSSISTNSGVYRELTSMSLSGDIIMAHPTRGGTKRLPNTLFPEEFKDRYGPDNIVVQLRDDGIRRAHTKLRELGFTVNDGGSNKMSTWSHPDSNVKIDSAPFVNSTGKFPSTFGHFLIYGGDTIE